MLVYILAKPLERLATGQVEMVPLRAVLPDLHLPRPVTLKLLQQDRGLALVVVETNWTLSLIV